jgi:hypothetical protein
MIIFGAVGIALIVFSVKYLYFDKNKQNDEASEGKTDGENVIETKVEELPDDDKADRMPDGKETAVTDKETDDKEAAGKEISDEAPTEKEISEKRTTE